MADERSWPRARRPQLRASSQRGQLQPSSQNASTPGSAASHLRNSPPEEDGEESFSTPCLHIPQRPSPLPRNERVTLSSPPPSGSQQFFRQQSSKRALDTEPHKQHKTRKITTHSENSSPTFTNNTSPLIHPPTARIKQTYTKLFLDISDLPQKYKNYSNFNKLLSDNRFSKYITHLQRTADNTGYVITFKQEDHANIFKAAPFDNQLDNCTIRNTNKPKRSITQNHTDVLIHNVNPTIHTDEIHQNIQDNYNIIVHSTYRLTAQSKYSNARYSTRS